MNALHESQLEIISGYQFRQLSRPRLWRERIENFVAALGLKGTVLVADEGINFSLSGPPAALTAWLDWLAGKLDVRAPVINRQTVEKPPFLRLKVRVRDEIVTFDAAIRPAPRGASGPSAVHAHPPGEALSAGDWNTLLDDPELQLIDTRNDYEVRLGSFVGAVNPKTATFTEFKAYCEQKLDSERPVAMFCTGGVRCEKASAWLKTRGFGRVYQLHGGILGYLAETPRSQSRWRGECFVFDDRVSLDATRRSCGRVVCRGCRKPAEGLDASGIPPFGSDGTCLLCRQRFDGARLDGLRERARQIALSGARGDQHPGPDAQSATSQS
ncbi:MAG: sulfurtransferase [Xanthomonadaceae bacterium]|nr:sulfurtransferase [Xanthomonadaceae bacterium]